MQITEWKLSNMIAKNDEPLSEGEHVLQIENAIYDDDKHTYTLVLRCVDSDQVSSVKYFLKKKDGSDNNSAIGTLNSLGNALFRWKDKEKGIPWKGIPFMDDLLDGIVRAYVNWGDEFVRIDGSTGHYVNIYQYLPVDGETFNDLKANGFKTIDQYTEG